MENNQKTKICLACPEENNSLFFRPNLARFFLFVLIFISGCISAQWFKKKSVPSPEKEADSVVVDNGGRDSLTIFKPDIGDFQYKNHFGKKALILDTVFSIQKSYVFTQWNGADNFGKMAFPNIGQALNPMVYEPQHEQTLSLLPEGKAPGILGIDDIRYYDVKAPTTIFMYHNPMKNGGQLSTTYTQNVGKDFNFALNYMGLRSLGAYRNSLSTNNNLLFSAHYSGDEGRYGAYAHFVHQNNDQLENGGIADLDNFTSGDSRFKNRLNLATNLRYSESKFKYRRLYLGQEYALFSVDDRSVKIRYKISRQSNKYFYTQSAREEYYVSDVISDIGRESGKHSTKLDNSLSLVFENDDHFEFYAGVKRQNIDFGADLVYHDSSEVLPETRNEARNGIEASLKANIGKSLDLVSYAEFTRGKVFGNFIRSDNRLSLEPIENYLLEGKLNFLSSAPSFNYLLNGSMYKDFNYILSDFKNQAVFNPQVSLRAKKAGLSVFFSHLSIKHFTYFDHAGLPNQGSSPLKIAQIGGDASLKYGNFHLDARILFQSSIQNGELFPVPKFILRSNLYYQDKAFKNASEVQIGVKSYYFSKFASREFFPLLNEFILPGDDTQLIGGRQMMDVYLNMKVKRMLIYIEGQHFNAAISGNKSFSAPLYPFVDFRLNLGVVWYIFS